MSVCQSAGADGPSRPGRQPPPAAPPPPPCSLRMKPAGTPSQLRRSRGCGTAGAPATRSRASSFSIPPERCPAIRRLAQVWAPAQASASPPGRQDGTVGRRGRHAGGLPPLDHQTPGPVGRPDVIPGDGERDVAVHRPVAAGERAGHVVHAQHVRLPLHDLPVRRREPQPGYVVARRTQPHLADHAAERPEHAPQGAVGVAAQREQVGDLERLGVAGPRPRASSRSRPRRPRCRPRGDPGERVYESPGIGRESRPAARERAVLRGRPGVVHLTDRVEVGRRRPAGAHAGRGTDPGQRCCRGPRPCRRRRSSS